MLTTKKRNLSAPQFVPPFYFLEPGLRLFLSFDLIVSVCSVVGEEASNLWSFPALSCHPSPAWCLFNILLFVKEFNHKTFLYLHDDELYRWCLFFLFSSPPPCLAACCCLCRNPPCRWHFIGQCHHALCILISRKWLRSWPRAKNDLATLPKILFLYFFFSHDALHVAVEMLFELKMSCTVTWRVFIALSLFILLCRSDFMFPRNPRLVFLSDW